MDKAVIHECTLLSFEDKITFPQVVQKLAAIGVERYVADLIRLHRTTYNTNNETYVESLPLKDAPAVPSSFNQSGVRVAIAAIQQGKINYTEFLRQMMKAGCCRYEVYITGKKVMYLGRDGEHHIENFPTKT